MTSLEDYFTRSKRFTGDCYVADFTNISGNLKGVVISEQPFEDIASFHLKKHSPSNIEYVGVNFEEHPAFISGIENCECMFMAVSPVKKPWILMLELKYCDEDNIENYAYKAYSQMRSTLGKIDKLNIIDSSKFNRYFVYSVPGHDAGICPFGAFTRTQNETLRSFEDSGIHLLGNNQMLIATPSYLFEPKRPV